MSRRLNIDQANITRFFEHRLPFSDLNRDEQREAMREMRRRGLTATQAAQLYDISADVYQHRMRRPLPAPLPAMLRISPAPHKPQCEGADPTLFDLKRNGWPQQAALDMCAKCQVTEWCLQQVRPRTSGFTGVAAGVAWVNGKPFGDRSGGKR